MSKGFFSDPKLAGVKKRDNKHPCERCKLYRNVKTPRMSVQGAGKKRIWVHGENPKIEEDKYGAQFHVRNQAGRLLRQKLRAHNIDLDRDCWKDNSVRCRTPEDRMPRDTEIKHCQTWVIPDLINHQPNKIFLLGTAAIKSLITTRLKGVKFDGVKKWIGWQIPDQQLKAWLFPIWHPSFLIDNEKNRALWLKFDQFLEAMTDHDRSFPHYKDPKDLVQIVDNPEDATSLLTKLIQEKRPAALDWETTGLKPHGEGHRIVTGAIATSRTEAWAFPIFENRRFLARLKRWLRDPDIEKYTHNQGMENSWALNVLGQEIRNIAWDSMEVAHIHDNRPDITSLKFQVYVNYGFVYGDEIQKYLRPTDANKKKYGANAINQIHEAPQDKLLLYNGTDALFTYWLSKDQMMRDDGWSADVVLAAIHGGRTLARVHEAGIPIDEKYCERQDAILEQRLLKVKQSIDESAESKKWTKTQGKELNPDSDVQLNKLLHKIMKLPPLKETAKGNPSVDKAVLQEIGTPFTTNIIRFRQINKLKNTYLGGFYRESINGVMRPFFPTHLVTTYRGSSSDPNFTNVPRRDKQAKRITRRAIKPRPGRQILDVDYKGIEVGMGACNSGDPKLITYVTDSSTNMHRDQATEIYLLDQSAVTKPLYDASKNSFVFPEFYGSYWGNCAPELWKIAQEETLADGTPVLEHLRDQGIKSYRKFEKHIQAVEDEFWNVKFIVYRDWKDSVWKFYQKYGYIELLTGHRCYWSPRGLLTRKECMNYPNQGPGFRCLLQSMIWLDDLVNEERGWSSRMIGQIHDDIVWDLEPSELTHLWSVLEQVMCRDIREHWPWIIVPLEIEGEATKIDGNWNEQQEIQL